MRIFNVHHYSLLWFLIDFNSSIISLGAKILRKQKSTKKVLETEKTGETEILELQTEEQWQEEVLNHPKEVTFKGKGRC